MNSNVGKRIFDKNMETRVTIRLDDKHKNTIKKVMKEKEFNSMSEAIRFIIENYQTKNNK